MARWANAMAHAAIGYAASSLDSPAESYANVARITLDAITAYAEDVRAGRQIKSGKSASATVYRSVPDLDRYKPS